MMMSLGTIFWPDSDVLGRFYLYPGRIVGASDDEDEELWNRKNPTCGYYME